jgi:hypothetical protein
MAALSSKGEGASWTAQKKNVLRIFELFRLSDETVAALLPLPFQQLGELDLCQNEVFACFSHYLLHTYIIENGQYKGRFLSCNSVVDYLQCLLGTVSDRFKANGTAETRLFLTCQDINANTDSAKWMQGLKKHIRKVTFSRAKEAGEELDKSETPLYLAHVQSLQQAYAKHGSSEVCAGTGMHVHVPAFALPTFVRLHCALRRLCASSPS